MYVSKPKHPGVKKDWSLIHDRVPSYMHVCMFVHMDILLCIVKSKGKIGILF